MTVPCRRRISSDNVVWTQGSLRWGYLPIQHLLLLRSEQLLTHTENQDGGSESYKSQTLIKTIYTIFKENAIRMIEYDISDNWNKTHWLVLSHNSALSLCEKYRSIRYVDWWNKLITILIMYKIKWIFNETGIIFWNM